MMRTLITTAVTLLLISGCAANSPRARVASDAKVTVTIDSRPEHAEILLDGKFVGTTPMAVRLSAGDHVVELNRPKYNAWRRDLTVVRDSPARMVALLQNTE